MTNLLALSLNWAIANFEFRHRLTLALSNSIVLLGWYDIFAAMNLESFQDYDQLSATRGQHRLIAGPRGHCMFFKRIPFQI